MMFRIECRNPFNRNLSSEEKMNFVMTWELLKDSEALTPLLVLVLGGLLYLFVIVMLRGWKELVYTGFLLAALVVAAYAIELFVDWVISWGRYEHQSDAAGH